MVLFAIRVKIPRYNNMYTLRMGVKYVKTAYRYLLTRSIVAGLISNDSFCEATVSVFFIHDL